jgi:hypothetical protein
MFSGGMLPHAFYGRSENAVRCQIWCALCAYLLVAILKKQQGLIAGHQCVNAPLGVILKTEPNWLLPPPRQAP